MRSSSSCLRRVSELEGVNKVSLFITVPFHFCCIILYCGMRGKILKVLELVCLQSEETSN